MNLKQNRFISISLSSTLVKVAQVTAKGVVEKLVRKDVHNNDVEAALRQALVGFDTKKAGVLCVIPGDVATTKNIELPSVDREEIESILALQASRFTPFSKDEILTSYIKLGTPKANFTRVLLVVVKREAVKERLTWIKGAGLHVETVVFVPEAITRFYAKGYSTIKNDAPVGLIDVNRQSTNFIVMARGTTVMFRNIPVGAEQLVGEGGARQELMEGIRASVDAYEQEGIGVKPAQFYLTFNHPVLAGLLGPLAEMLGSKVSIASYLTWVNASKSVKDVLTKDFSDESALDIISTGVTVAKCETDLVPQEIRDHRAVSQKGRETLIAGILILVSLIFIGGGLLSKVYFKDRFLKQNLIEKYSEQRQQVQNLESMITRTRILRQYLEARTLPLEAIRELFRIIPQEIFLTNITNDDAGNLSIQGVSESMSKVFSFVTALEESPLFDAVKTKSTAAKKDRGKDVASFEIVMKLVSVGAAPSSKD
ncbi:MAG: pilus assembly protein PilM [Candidatus Omnitrophica bacterium]|nr:pilus assembly protein PilM [Candidatus Omnitrophota bacterium]